MQLFHIIWERNYAEEYLSTKLRTNFCPPQCLQKNAVHMNTGFPVIHCYDLNSEKSILKTLILISQLPYSE